MSERITWTYWITRIADACTLWYVKPTRRRVDGGAEWYGFGKLGTYPAEHVKFWFHTIPDDDSQLVRVEQYPTQAMLDEQKAMK